VEGPNGLPIRLSFAPTVPEAQREALRRLPEMIEYAESVFGPYPFESMGATVTSTGQGLAFEAQTLPIFGSLGASQDAPVSSDTIASFEHTVFHELSHQWFGNSVSLQNWRDIWLSEGFAVYGEALWIEHMLGAGVRDEMLGEYYEYNFFADQLTSPDILKELTAADVVEALWEFGLCADEECFSLVGASGQEDLDKVPAEVMLDALAASGLPAEEFPGIPLTTGDPGGAELFSWTGIFGRGALTVHALRLEVGDDAFFAVLEGWTQRHDDGNGATADFIVTAEDVSGQELDAFFQAWLFELALPELVLP
jgi:aminopeptidase N